MIESRKSKFKKFIGDRNTTTNTNSNSNNNTNNRIPFFNPTKMLRNSGNSEYVVRVIPNRYPDEMFFYSYYKHFVNLGVGQFKQFICLNNADNTVKDINGKQLNNYCPLCQYLMENESNSNVKDNPIYTKLKSKQFHTLWIFDYASKQIMRYETSDFGISNIVSNMIALFEERNISESEGFDIVFKEASFDNNNSVTFAKCVEARIPQCTLDEIFKVNGRFNSFEELPTLAHEVVPYNEMQTYKYINKNVNDIIESVYPFDLNNITNYFIDVVDEEKPNNYNSNDGIVESETNPIKDSVSFDFDDVTTNTNNETPKYDINDIEDTSSVTYAEENTTDDDIDDIRAFLNNRNK